MLSTCAAPCARTPVLLGRGSKTSGGRALRRANAARKSAAPKMGRDRRICAVRADAALPESELEEGEIQGVRPRLACAGRHRAAPSAREPTARAPIVHPAPRPTFGATGRATSPQFRREESVTWKKKPFRSLTSFSFADLRSLCVQNASDRSRGTAPSPPSPRRLCWTR